MEEKELKVIDLGMILKVLLSKKTFFLKAWVITFILSCVWILPQPRTYEASVSLAPETAGDDMSGSLSSLASSFGISLGSGGGVDAIYPTLYPDVLENNEFLVSLFNINVKSLDGTIDTNLYNYLDKHQKAAFYEKPISWVKTRVNEMMSKSVDIPSSGKKGINPFMLTKRQTLIVTRLKKALNCAVDKKTNVISLSVVAQDPLIAATLVDSVSGRLQGFITGYRTSKARNDLDYYTKLAENARQEYETIRRQYAGMADSNTDVMLPSYQTKLNDVENTMQLKFNTYTAVCAQVDASRAKLQERTPAFTKLKCATVPIKPSGPKRMIFVALMLILVTIGSSAWLIFKNREGLI